MVLDYVPYLAPRCEDLSGFVKRLLDFDVWLLCISEWIHKEKCVVASIEKKACEVVIFDTYDV